MQAFDKGPWPRMSGMRLPPQSSLDFCFVVLSYVLLGAMTLCCLFWHMQGNGHARCPLSPKLLSQDCRDDCSPHQASSILFLIWTPFLAGRERGAVLYKLADLLEVCTSATGQLTHWQTNCAMFLTFMRCNRYLPFRLLIVVLGWAGKSGGACNAGESWQWQAAGYVKGWRRAPGMPSYNTYFLQYQGLKHLLTHW